MLSRMLAGIHFISLLACFALGSSHTYYDGSPIRNSATFVQNPHTNSCRVAVVGAGWAGVYAAWRLAVDTQTVVPRQLCIFEARRSIGGRTYSVDVDVAGGETLVVDIGAYRFSKSQHLPADLIEHLNLSSQCYKPSCGLEEGMVLYRIVGNNGDSIGYATAMQAMLKQLQGLGVQILYEHELVAILPANISSTHDKEKLPTTVHFRNKAQITVQSLILNLPRPSIDKMHNNSVIFQSEASEHLLRNCTTMPIKAFKVYVIYEDPWWLTKLNASEGYFMDYRAEPPFAGRYHDGAINRYPGDWIGAGALELVYTYTTDTSFDWYLKYRTNWSDPLTLSQDRDLLVTLHRRLMDVHAKNFTARGFNVTSIAMPVKVVMGFWDKPGLSASILVNPEPVNMHAQWGKYPRESCLHSVSPDQYIAAVSVPSRRHDVFLANNDYFWDMYSGSGCCWAENSLKPMEKILHDHFSLGKPSWLNRSYYEQDVLGYGESPLSEFLV